MATLESILAIYSIAFFPLQLILHHNILSENFEGILKNEYENYNGSKTKQ